MDMISKEEAIKNHRAMWNWIADQYEKGSNKRVRILKREYIDTMDPNRDELIKKLYMSCYCCYYAGINNIVADNEYLFNCDQCPVVWPSYAGEGMCCEGTSRTIGLYEFIEECTDVYMRIDEIRDILVKLCRLVADLPENTYNGSAGSIGNLAEEQDRLIDMYHNLCEEAEER